MVYGAKLSIWSFFREKQKINIWILIHIIFIVLICILIYLLVSKIKSIEKKDKINNELIQDNNNYKKIINDEKGKNDYFVNLSHELRTPLNVILSTEQLITNLNSRDENIDKEKLDYYMNILRSNSKRLLKLINDIIDTSKIESGQYKLNISEYDIIYQIEEIAFSLKDYIESKGITLIIDPQIEEKKIEGDINDMEKCIVNLLGNAVKFTNDGGKIVINIYDLGAEVQIDVVDTGIGIPEGEIDNIFDRFGQAYNKKSEEFGGSGIGLALTKQLVELHHGTLTVQSKEGEGSIFTIRIPCKQPGFEIERSL